MLTIHDTRPMRHCQGQSRREFLRVGSLGLAGLTLPRLLAARAANRALIRDKAVVMLFLVGGPPQIETFDPKPDGPADIRSCTGSVPTRLAGVQFGGTFPKLAAMADRLAIVRSYGSGDATHNPLPALTGNSTAKATMAAHYARIAGPYHPVTAMPSTVVVPPEGVKPDLKLPTKVFTAFGLETIRNDYTRPGIFGAPYKAMVLDGPGATANLQLQIPRERFADRHSLLQQFDQLRRHLDADRAYEAADTFQQQAIDVLTRGVVDAFDWSKEDPRTIARYDTSHLLRPEEWHLGGPRYHDLENQNRWTNLLGKQMLLARRLVEAGCGFVTVVDGTYDFHGNNVNPPTTVGMPVLGPQVDHAVSVFLDDLKERGLSDKVLLIVTGEMGRQPRKEKNGGTGHWGKLTPLLFAGGGLKMGQVIGTTDRHGAEPTSSPYAPQHLLATIMQTLFDPLEARQANLPSNLADVITTSDSIRELF